MQELAKPTNKERTITMTVEDLIKHLQENYKPEDVIAHDIWQVDDVTCDGNHHEEIDPPVTKEEAEEVLHRMEHNKDASIGLNWDVLNHHLSDVIRERKEIIKTAKFKSMSQLIEELNPSQEVCRLYLAKTYGCFVGKCSNARVQLASFTPYYTTEKELRELIENEKGKPTA